ncbi:MAG: hypothetical protein LBB07_00935, partial [Bifidobacteriaceae bacterium]|nr:hypothetical protein [Bifidobacteriaceae bacterium]
NADGSVPAKADGLEGKCEKVSGYRDIAMLYYRILVNPDRDDTSNLSAQCLTKLGYAPQGYSGQEYLSDNGGRVNASGYGKPEDQLGSNASHMTSDGKVIPGIDWLKCQNDPKVVLSEK